MNLIFSAKERVAEKVVAPSASRGRCKPGDTDRRKALWRDRIERGGFSFRRLDWNVRAPSGNQV